MQRLQGRNDDIPRQHASIEDDGRSDAAERSGVPALGAAAHAGGRAGRAAPLRDRPCAGQAVHSRQCQPRQPEGLC